MVIFNYGRYKTLTAAFIGETFLVTIQRKDGEHLKTGAKKSKMGGGVTEKEGSCLRTRRSILQPEVFVGECSQCSLCLSEFPKDIHMKRPSN